jgi:hypothetical protein
MGAVHRGHAFSLEHKAKISKANTGKVRTAEMRARLSVAKKGIPSSRKGIPASDETRAKISAAKTNPSPETREKMAAAKRGRILPLETRAKMSMAATGRVKSPETCAKLSLANWKGGKRISIQRSRAHRRLLGFVPLNKPFNGCEGHHIDNEQVIHIPKELHRSIWHRQSNVGSMAKINAVAYNFLFKQEVEATLEAQHAGLA